jgi:hypothetical protein
MTGKEQGFDSHAPPHAAYSTTVRPPDPRPRGVDAKVLVFKGNHCLGRIWAAFCRVRRYGKGGSCPTSDGRSGWTALAQEKAVLFAPARVIGWPMGDSRQIRTLNRHAHWRRLRARMSLRQVGPFAGQGDKARETHHSPIHTPRARTAKFVDFSSGEIQQGSRSIRGIDRTHVRSSKLTKWTKWKTSRLRSLRDNPDLGEDQKNWARRDRSHRAPLVMRREGICLFPDATGKRGKPRPMRGLCPLCGQSMLNGPCSPRSGKSVKVQPVRLPSEWPFWQSRA